MHFVYDNWGCTLIYQPLSYPFTSKFGGLKCKICPFGSYKKIGDKIRLLWWWINKIIISVGFKINGWKVYTIIVCTYKSNPKSF